MQIQALSEGAFAALDTACNGIFGHLQDFCTTHRYQAHLTIQTHLEGLQKGEMKLYIQVTDGNETKDFAIARLEGSAKIIGWDIYLHDRLDSAKSYLGRADEKIKMLGEPLPARTALPQISPTIH
jgi:hypothetical protein